MSEDDDLPQQHRTVQSTKMQRHQSHYDLFGEHMENYNIETTALHRKLQSKVEALRILRKELEKFRTERDQFKLMAETLQLRYAPIRRNCGTELYDGGCGGQLSVATILHETRERNINLTTEVEALKQKLAELQGDIEVLRSTSSAPRSNETRHEGSGIVGAVRSPSADNELQQWKQERSNFICHLEHLKKKNAQLAFDFKSLIDEKEELITERDAYKCKVHRLNHELIVALQANETHPKFLDIDSIILENKYLYERLKNTENEMELVKQSLNKYKTMLDSKRKKGIVKLGSQTNDESILTHKQVKQLLESGIELPLKTETIQDLKSLCLALLDNLNDKNIALNHQKKTNKMLATKIAELEKRMQVLTGFGTNEVGYAPAQLLLKGYCPSSVDSNHTNDTATTQPTSAASTTSTTSTTLKGDSAGGNVTEDSGTMSSEPEDSLKTSRGAGSDDAMSSLSTESGRSILSSEYGGGSIEISDDTDVFPYKMPLISTSASEKSNQVPIVPNSIVKERCADLKDLPPDLAALVQKALHELDLRDFDEVVSGICEDIAEEADEKNAALGRSDSVGKVDSETNQEQDEMEEGAVGGNCITPAK